MAASAVALEVVWRNKRGIMVVYSLPIVEAKKLLSDSEGQLVIAAVIRYFHGITSIYRSLKGPGYSRFLQR